MSARGSQPHRFVLTHSWDGAPLPKPEHVFATMVRARGLLRITVDAPWHGDPAPDAPSGPVWGLWNHEVVEIFIAGPEGRYLEIELGPHGHHLVLQLQGVRNVIARELPIRYTTQRQGERWVGEAIVDESLLPEEPHRVNLHAIHGGTEARLHASLHPAPGEAPNFHRLDVMEPLDWQRQASPASRS